MARKLAQKALWSQRGYLQQQKCERMLYNKKKFAKNFYNSFILIKFGDLKPSLPLAM